MKVTALLTGRGNNTLRDKNVLPVLGKPLLYYPANSAKQCKYVTDLYVSSDDSRILDTAAELGYIKIHRPEEFALPTSQHEDVIRHALSVIKEDTGSEPDILIVLLANNGIVKTSWINTCVEEILKDPSVSAAVPVYKEQEHHPFRAKKLDENGNLVPFVDGLENVSTNRQDLPDCLHLGHNFWVLNVKEALHSKDGLPPWKFMGKKVKPLVVEMCADVHTIEDIHMTERWLVDNYE